MENEISLYYDARSDKHKNNLLNSLDAHKLGINVSELIVTNSALALKFLKFVLPTLYKNLGSCSAADTKSQQERRFYV